MQHLQSDTAHVGAATRNPGCIVLYGLGVERLVGAVGVVGVVRVDRFCCQPTPFQVIGYLLLPLEAKVL